MGTVVDPLELRTRQVLAESRAYRKRVEEQLDQMHPVIARCVDRLLANVARKVTGLPPLPANHDYYEPWWKDE